MLILELLLSIGFKHWEYIFFHKLSDHLRRDLVIVEQVILRKRCASLCIVLSRSRLRCWRWWLECRGWRSLIIVGVDLDVLWASWSYASRSGLRWLYSIILLVQKRHVSGARSTRFLDALLSWLTVRRGLKTGSILGRMASNSWMSYIGRPYAVLRRCVPKAEKSKVWTCHGILGGTNRILKLCVIILHHSLQVDDHLFFLRLLGHNIDLVLMPFHSQNIVTWEHIDGIMLRITC